MSGYTMTQVEELYTLNAAITKNNYSTEAAFTGVAGTSSVCSLPAGYFALENPNPVGRTLRLKVQGTIANTAAATFAVNLGLDSTPGTKANPLTVFAATAPTASVTALWTCEAEYTCTAFTTSQVSFQVNGYWTQSATASGAALGSGGLRTDFQGALTGIDPRVQLYFELFGTWSAANAANTTTVQQMKLFGEN